ncbi:MAG: antitoxin Xre/MbcA/ParS toxin-binding domain-containing protein [Ferruginibacter sp.]
MAIKKPNKDHDNILQELNEPAAAFQISPTLRIVSAPGNKEKRILRVASSTAENHMSAIEKMTVAKAGISKLDLEHLKTKTRLDYDKLATVLSVTRATLINKKGKDKFNPSVSEKIVSLADIYAFGYEVFEDEEKFNKWMFRPNTALGGEVPYFFIDNEFGREEIKNLIGRIEYGVYS